MTTPKTKPPSRGTSLNTAKKAEICALWQAGTVTLDELAKKFKVNKRTLLRLFEREGIKKNENASKTKQIVADAVEASIINDAAIYAARVKDTKEEHYKMATTLSKLIYSKVATAERAGIMLSTISGDLKSLQLAMSSLKMAREERYATLGIRADDVSDDKPLHDLFIQELTAEDIRKMSETNMVSDDDDIGLDTSMGDEDFIDHEEQNEKVILD